LQERGPKQQSNDVSSVVPANGAAVIGFPRKLRCPRPTKKGKKAGQVEERRYDRDLRPKSSRPGVRDEPRWREQKKGERELDRDTRSTFIEIKKLALSLAGEKNEKRGSRARSKTRRT